MINFDDVRKENMKEHDPHLPQILDYPYRILIIGDSGSGKTNSLFNFISHPPHIDKICLYAKDPYEAKYRFLINKRESTGLKHLNDSEAFIEYSNDLNIDKCKCLTDKEILPSVQSAIIEQGKFIYSPLGKTLEKQRKTIEEQGNQQVKALEVLKPNTHKITIKNVILENKLSEEAKNELNEIKEVEETVDRENLVYKMSERTYSFKNFRKTKIFDRDIYNGTTTLEETNKDQSDLLIENLNFWKHIKPQNSEKKGKKIP